MSDVTTHAACLFRPPPITECGRVVAAGDPSGWQLAVMAVLVVGLCVMVCLPIIYHKAIRWGDENHKERK